MSKIFIVEIKQKRFLFSRENFLRFCGNIKNYDWTFEVGEKDTNIPLKNSHLLAEEEIFELFTLEEIKPLLKYKSIRYGSSWINDYPFFSKRFYLKYGNKIGWHDGYF